MSAPCHELGGGSPLSTETKRWRFSEAVKGECSTWTHHHVSVFILTFFSYSLFHATRKTFSNVKTTISAEWTPFNTSYPDIYPYTTWNSHQLFDNEDDASFFLGELDTTFLVSYALGLFVSGILGDRFNLRKVLTIGMCTSALSAAFFGTVSEWLGIYSKWYYIFFWMLTGLLQSSGWPAVVAVMGNWFGKSSRGFILGLWAATASVGNIIGAYTAAAVLQHGYEYSFLLPASLTFAGGIIVFFSLVTSPREVGLPQPDDDDDDSVLVDSVQEPLLSDDNIGPEINSCQRPKAVGFLKAFQFPGVIAYSFAYACLKFVNYSFFFWLPYYLNHKYGWQESDADRLSIWYDVGGILGGVIGGIISDFMKTRSPVLGVLLILSPGCLLLYYVSPANMLINGVLMTVVGFFVGGAANLISTAVTADLGRQKGLSGDREALATVTGIIDGTGSVGAAIGQILVPLSEKRLGWQYVFYLFMVMTILTLLCISRIIWNDMRDLCRGFCCRSSDNNSSLQRLISIQVEDSDDPSLDYRSSRFAKSAVSCM